MKLCLWVVELHRWEKWIEVGYYPTEGDARWATFSIPHDYPDRESVRVRKLVPRASTRHSEPMWRAMEQAAE